MTVVLHQINLIKKKMEKEKNCKANSSKQKCFRGCKSKVTGLFILAFIAGLVFIVLHVGSVDMKIPRIIRINY